MACEDCDPPGSSALSALLLEVAACICATIDPDETFCSCGLAPGTQVAAHLGECDSGCGQAWVRLVRAYPADGVGVTPTNPSACGTFLGADVEIGVFRCLAVPDNGDPIEAGGLEAAALQQIDDLVTVRAALACCEALKDVDWALTTYVPHGPRGLIVGGLWNLSLVI